MAEYVTITKDDENIQIVFYVEDNKIMTIGEKMNGIHEDAYMNGYNWDAFFHYYLTKNAPDLLDDMDTDPEAGIYIAYYDMTPQNEVKANKFIEIIHSLIENEEELYRIVREESHNIQWD